MRTTPLPAFERTAAETFASDPRRQLHLESVDCEICGRHYVAHLFDLANGDQVGLCTEHLGEFARLYAQSAQVSS